VKGVFPSLLKQHKWFKYKRDARVGDVVLRKDETAAGQTYKNARITKVHEGSDGKVRAEDIEYKVPGESRFRSTTRPIHKLVLIVPVEEQTIEEEEGRPDDQDEEESVDQWPGMGEGDGVEHDKTEHKEEDEMELPKLEEERGQTVETESGEDIGDRDQVEGIALETKRRATPAMPKIQLSDEVEAITDVGQARKKGRGRPRKMGLASNSG
jgi:hypothetical protein